MIHHSFAPIKIQNMSGESDDSIEDTLIDILSRDEQNYPTIADDFSFVLNLIETNEVTKILRLAVKTLEKVK
jgi:hypothetical protein